MPSAASPLALFGHFVRTMQPLDSPATFIPDLYLIGFSERPADCAGATGVSRFSPVEFLCMHGVYDSAGSRRTRMFSHTASLSFRLAGHRRRPGLAISELHTQPTYTPVQRFQCGLTTALAWLAARV